MYLKIDCTDNLLPITIDTKLYIFHLYVLYHLHDLLAGRPCTNSATDIGSSACSRKSNRDGVISIS